MKNKPLFVQIWLVIMAITIVITLLLLTILPSTLGQFFTRESYNIIEDAQNAVLPGKGVDRDQWSTRLLDSLPSIERDQEKQSIRTVRHVQITEEGRMVPATKLPASFSTQAVNQALHQANPEMKYAQQFGDEKIFYIIRKETVRNKQVYLLSYMWDANRNKLVNELYFRVAITMGILILFCWIPALWLAKYLSRPLVKLEKHVQTLADRDWHQPIELDRRDEIGRLAQSMERTREQLLRQDEAQQSLLQHISHELKTPVMVIRSYVQSIQDGIYPKGDLNKSIEVIDGEAARLEKQIRDLLYLTRLDYMSTRKAEQHTETIELHLLTQEVIDRLRWRRPELVWELDLQPITIQGNKEQWTVALENILDNQIRYANKLIQVSTAARNLKFANDGPPLEADVLMHLFDLFKSGPRGEFGLGLAIVKRIMDLHQVRVRAHNEAVGVAFYLELEAS